MRKIVVLDETWEYFIGKHNVVIRSPRNDKKMIFTLEMITGKSPDSLEQGRRKKTKDGMITPAHLKSFIQKNFPYTEDGVAA